MHEVTTTSSLCLLVTFSFITVAQLYDVLNNKQEAVKHKQGAK